MAETKKAPAKAAKTAAKKTVAKKTATKSAAKTAAKKTAAKAAPTHAQIAALAHKYWEERGHHHGYEAQDWLRAEKELKG